jgi:hypothetical protein
MWISYGAMDRSDAYEGRRAVEAVARNAERGATVLHHRSPLWYMVLVEERRQDLTLVDPFCTSWDRRTDLVWPDDLNAAQSAARYGTDDTTGVEAARKAADAARSTSSTTAGLTTNASGRPASTRCRSETAVNCGN